MVFLLRADRSEERLRSSSLDSTLIGQAGISVSGANSCEASGLPSDRSEAAGDDTIRGAFHWLDGSLYRQAG